MAKYPFHLILLLAFLASCNSNNEESQPQVPKVHSVGAMKDAMWKGELFPKIQIDTISNKKGIYGIGPLSYMRGEILINDGTPYVSFIKNDSVVTEVSNEVGAPFFVYSHVLSWDSIPLPKSLTSIVKIENYIAKISKDTIPFVFKLRGSVKSATIHIQNLPEGTTVKSPKEAHLGQRRFQIKNRAVEIIGFYSTQHQGIFTHHDSFSHMHLITDDLKVMGHLDKLDIDNMTILFPKRISSK